MRGRGLSRGLVYASVCVPLALKFVVFLFPVISSLHFQEANQRAENYQGLIHEVYTHRDAEVKPGRSFSVTILCFLWKFYAAGLLSLL